MTAYYQNQVVSTTEHNSVVATTVFSNDINKLSFTASQQVGDNCTKNVIRRLSMQSSKDNPAKVYCVCLFDELNGNEPHKDYLFKGDSISALASSAVTEDNKSVPNSFYIEPTVDDTTGSSVGLTVYSSPTVNGSDSGYIVNKDRNEYIDIDWINALSDKLASNNARLLSPLSLLTRKNKERMGGGDIIVEDEFKDDADAILALWYDNNLYWTDTKPEGAKNISDVTCFIASYYMVKPKDDNTEGMVKKFSLMPVSSKLNPCRKYL